MFNASMTGLQAITQICHAQYYFKYNLKNYSQYINAACFEVHLGMGDPFLFYFKPKFNPDFNENI